MNIKFLSRILIALALIVMVTASFAQLQAQEDATPADDTQIEEAPKEEPRTAETQPEKNKNYSETYKYLNLFGDVFERVRSEYVEEVADKDLIEYAVNGMLSSLDPHSSYLNEERFNEMKVETRGQFGGLGIEVTMENGLVKVVSPIDDTPAFRAGIQAGDYIVKIDGEAVMGLTLSDAVKMMRGKVGTTIDLEIHRENMEAPMEVTLTRDVINIKSVRHRVEGNAGYIRITQFSQNTDEGVREAVEDIKKQLGGKLIGYVLDLRNNPGGLLDQAIAVSDDFLETGEIVSTRGRKEDDTKRDNATPGDIAGGLPVVILINGGSASASEIVSGALQDHKRAIVLGTKSFGKGSVQTVIPLPGHGAMRLTTARYYTPSGRSIQATGIEPDIFVEQAKVEAYNSISRLREADLHGALDKENAKKSDQEKKKDEPEKSPAPVPDNKDQSSGNTPSNDNKPKTADGEEDQEAEDYQLARALDLLSGLSLYKPPAAANE